MTTEPIEFNASYLPVPDHPLDMSEAAAWLANEFKPIHIIASTCGDIAQTLELVEERSACWLLGTEAAHAAAACGRAILEGRPIRFRATDDAMDRLAQLSALVSRLSEEGFGVEDQADLIATAISQRETLSGDS